MEACSSVSMEAWSVVFDDDPELGELLDLALGDDNAEAAAAAGHKRRMMAAVASMNATGGQGPQGKKHKVDAFSWEKPPSAGAQRIRRPPAGTFPTSGNTARGPGGGSCSLLRVICIILKRQVFFCCECCRKRGVTPHFCGLQDDNFWLSVSLHGGGHSTASGQTSGPTCLVGASRGEQAKAIPFAVKAGAVHGGVFISAFFSRGLEAFVGRAQSLKIKGRVSSPTICFAIKINARSTFDACKKRVSV